MDEWMNKRKILSTGSTGQISCWLFYAACVECSRGTECLPSRVFRVTGTRWPRSRETNVGTWPNKRSTTIIADYCTKIIADCSTKRSTTIIADYSTEIIADCSTKRRNYKQIELVYVLGLMYFQSEGIHNRDSNFTCPFSGHVSSLSCIITTVNRTHGSFQGHTFLKSNSVLWRCGPTRAMASPFLRFLDHT